MSLARNSAWNLVAFGCALAANFVSIPFVVAWIGLEAFGRAGVVLAICAPLVLVGTVLSQALTRELASLDPAPGASGDSRRLVEAALRLGGGAGAAGWLALTTCGPLLAQWISRGQLRASELAPAFAIAAAGWAAQQLALLMQGIPAARQDFRTVAQVSAAAAALTLGAILAATWLSPTVEGFLAGVSAGFALSLAVWTAASSRAFSVAGIVSGDRRRELAALLRFGKWQGVAQLAGQMANQVDRYVLAALAPVAVVGQYNVANRLQEAAYIGVIKASEVLFPRFGRMSGHAREARLEVFQLASWAVGAFAAMVLAPLVPLAAPVLTLWVGAPAAEGAAPMLQMLVLGGIVGAGSNVFVYYSMGMGQTGTVAAISVVYSVVTVAASVLLLAWFGPRAAGAGLLLASVVRVAQGMYMTRREFFPELRWGALARTTALPVACGCAVALACQATGAFAPTGWVALGRDYAAIAALVLAACAAATAAAGGGTLLSRFAEQARRAARP